VPTGQSVKAPIDLRPGLERERQRLGASHAAARTEKQRAVILVEASRFLERSLADQILPRWDGTAWSFSGTTREPGRGSIACGYLVSTTLEEAGLRVERARLAQQPSEDIIKTLVAPAAIARFSDTPIEAFVAAVAARGDGLYLVGLDNHVGYLVVRGGAVWFHHASYMDPVRVVREPALASKPLASSRYRVVGRLFADAALAESWLGGKPIPTFVRAGRQGGGAEKSKVTRAVER
jgi:hypothetical protein